MSDTPLYERNSVLTAATIFVGVSLFLLQPFVTAEWPATVRGWWLGRPAVQLTLTAILYTASVALGYAFGRRSRPRLPAQPLLEHFESLSSSSAPLEPEAVKTNAEPEVSWEQLHEDERRALALLLKAPGCFMFNHEFKRHRDEWGWDIQRWNATIHSLQDEHELVFPAQRRLPRATQRVSAWGFQLTEVGRRVTTEAYRCGKLGE